MPTRFGKKLKELRKKREETQSELGILLGVTLKQIQRYEKDLVPKPETIQRLNNHYKYDFFALLKADTIEIEKDLSLVLGEHEERIIRLEATIEVFESILVSLLGEDKQELKKKITHLNELVNQAANRRFDELGKK